MGDEPPAARLATDTAARPHWQRTGYKYFPYAARQSGQWWVLRLNHGFPEHDMYTLFVDANAVADITGNTEDSVSLVASIGSLKPYGDAVEPALDAETARAVVGNISKYVNYGSEHDDLCPFCSSDYHGMTRI
jgi:hypothetical protein